MATTTYTIHTHDGQNWGTTTDPQIAEWYAGKGCRVTAETRGADA